MGFLRHIIGLILVILLSALAATAMPMAPKAGHQAEFFPHQKAAVAQRTEVHFAARAPPMAVPNVAITGDVTVMHGGASHLHGHETYVSSWGFSAGLDAPNSVGCNGSTGGSVGEANFAQTAIRSDRTFSPDGQQIYSDIAGYPIRTVDDLSGALRRGDISPSDVPVDFVDMNGSRLILNTRTSTALQDAGIPQSQWYGTQRTGQTAYTDAAGNPVTYNDLATNQLNNNNLPPTGSPTLPTGQ